MKITTSYAEEMDLIQCECAEDGARDVELEASRAAAPQPEMELLDGEPLPAWMKEKNEQ